MAENTQKLRQKNDELTFIVMKDQLASRSFKIPFRLISRFSLVFSFFILAAFLSLLFSIRILLSPEGEELKELEQMKTQVSEIIAENQSLKEQLAVDEARFSEAVPTTEDPEFKAGLIYSKEDLPLQLTDFSTTWVNKNSPYLKVNFNLRYIKTDNRSQQGKIVILAKGTDVLYTHPKNIFQLKNNTFTLNPNNGESFFVSRFRSTEAQLGPMANENSIQNIEVYLFNEKGEILFIQNFSPTGSKK